MVGIPEMGRKANLRARRGMIWLFVVGLALAGGAVLRAEAQSGATVADVIVVHGKLYTVNPAQPWAEAVAIKDGKIVAVGNNEDVLKLRGTGTRVIDVKGNLVLPGFGDAHVHFMEGSMTL